MTESYGLVLGCGSIRSVFTGDDSNTRGAFSNGEAMSRGACNAERRWI
ncbi:hypothetical protein [Texcoconibacillus texcoconensis]|uniref:Uncharacterized protein n=1 Tax=Texcoconibacillus texcoconensis TaxID=1095777 RepID=A0A840QQQ9_9BACI|nr:hypothetical protein [Texcoconibacillus texcoconensis]MBB5173637.1 hypothetical protein [Texcoconibacillus texcoconensis]